MLAEQQDSCALAGKSSLDQLWAAHVHSGRLGAGLELHSAQVWVLGQVVVLAAVEQVVGAAEGPAWDPKAFARHRAATSCAAMTIGYVLVQACRKTIPYQLIQDLVRRSFGTLNAQTK